MRHLLPLLTCLLLAGSGVARAQGAPLSPAELNLLQRLVLAEAGGEGELGMALVARSVLNRVALLKTGAVAPSDYLAPRATLSGVVYAPRQYQPVRDGRLGEARSAAELAAAARAIALARDSDALRARLRARGLSDLAIGRLLRATGFRTHSAFQDRSQAYGREALGGHVFNGDGASARRDVVAAFERCFGRAPNAQTQAGAPGSSSVPASAPRPTKGLVGAVNGAR